MTADGPVLAWVPSGDASGRLADWRDGSTDPASALAVVYFLGLAAVVLGPALGPGYVLSLDMIFGPHTDYAGVVLETKGPAYYGRLPLAVAMDGAAAVLPDWTIQQAALVLVVAGGGLGAFRSLDGLLDGAPGLPAKLFAGTLYAVNPFVHVRLLAGHWYFLLGYAAIPPALAAYADVLAGRGSRWRAAGWATLVAIADPHAALLLALVGTCVTATTVLRSRRARASPGVPAAGRSRGVLGRAVRFGGVALACNAFWLVPATAAVVRGDSRLGAITGQDLVAFASEGTVAGNVPLSVAMLYGFWRGGYRLPVDTLSTPVAVGLFCVVLFLAIYGALDRRGPAPFGVGIAVGGGFVLAVGVAHPVTAPVYERLFDVLPPLRGMRDTQKFVGVIVLGYAVLGGAGVDALDRHRWRPRPAGRTATAVVLAGLVLASVVALPVAYSLSTVDGADGQLDRTTYPASWHAADRALADDRDEFRTVFLPLRGYHAFEWAGGTVANPAPRFFRGPVVAGQSLDVGGIERGGDDPTRTQLRAALSDARSDGTANDLGKRLADLGIKYVLLSRTADHDRYADLPDHPQLTPIGTDPSLLVLRNEAYGDAPPPSEWPRSGHRVPWTALGAGVGTSVAALGARWPGRAVLSRPAGA